MTAIWQFVRLSFTNAFFPDSALNVTWGSAMVSGFISDWDQDEMVPAGQPEPARATSIIFTSETSGVEDLGESVLKVGNAAPTLVGRLKI